MIKDSPQRYGLISQLFHWVMAFFLIKQTVGVIAGYVNDADNVVSHFLHGSHQPTGVIILALVGVRIAWVSYQAQRPPQEGKLGQLARFSHILLYVLMVLVPVSGLLLIWGEGKGLEVYGVTLFSEGEATSWAETLGGALHTPLSWTLCILMTGHIVAALLHHFVLRDRTLIRMLGLRPGSSSTGPLKTETGNHD
jgi:cytochrome b561